MTTTLAMAMLGVWLLQAPATLRVEGPEAARPPATVANEPAKGNRMRVPGAVLTAIGGAFLVAGAGMFIAQARCQKRHAIDIHASGECWWFVQGLWMAPVGLLTASVGVPLLVVGQRRHRRWKAWRDQHGLALQPRVGRIPRGWALAIELRF